MKLNVGREEFLKTLMRVISNNPTQPICKEYALDITVTISDTDITINDRYSWSDEFEQAMDSGNIPVRKAFNGKLYRFIELIDTVTDSDKVDKLEAFLENITLVMISRIGYNDLNFLKDIDNVDEFYVKITKELISEYRPSYPETGDLEYSTESFEESLEASDINSNDEESSGSKKEEDETNKIHNMVIKAGSKVTEVKLKVKGFLDKADVVRRTFYARNLDKVDSLYKNYGDVTIVENKLYGDPVNLLVKEVSPYLINLIDSISKIHDEYGKLMESLLSCKDKKDTIPLVNGFLSNYVKSLGKVDDTTKPAKFKDLVNKEIRHRVGEVLLSNRDIYGHNIDGIVKKKYPNANFAVVCQFVSNPNEEPTEQSVNSIFSSPESFRIMSKEMKGTILASIKLINSKATKTGVEEADRNYKEAIKNFDNTMKTEMQKNKAINGNKDVEKPLSPLKVIKAVSKLEWRFVPLYLYCIDGANALYDLSLRLDTTCMNAIKAMLNEEGSKADTTSGIKVKGDRVIKNTKDNRKVDLKAVEDPEG